MRPAPGGMMAGLKFARLYLQPCGARQSGSDPEPLPVKAPSACTPRHIPIDSSQACMR